MKKTEEKEKTEENNKDLFEGLSVAERAEALKEIEAYQAEAKKKKDALLEKIDAYDFKDEKLMSSSGALSRKEKKTLKKKGVDIGSYNVYDGNDDVIDEIIELRGLKDEDFDLDYKAHFWATKIIIRTLFPFEYEGND